VLPGGLVVAAVLYMVYGKGKPAKKSTAV